MNIEYVIVEEFLQKAGMTADEFGDISVIEQFIEATELEYDTINQIPDEIIKNCAYSLKSRAPISYGHLIAETEIIDRNEIDLSKMKQAVIMRTRDASISCLVLDFEMNRAYVSLHDSIVENVCYSEKTIILTDEAVEDVAAVLENAGILDAEYEYRGDTSYRQDMIIAMGFPNGVARYVSYGIDSGIPVDIINACNYLIKYFYNM